MRRTIRGEVIASSQSVTRKEERLLRPEVLQGWRFSAARWCR
jgi:hypothetical protein